MVELKNQQKFVQDREFVERAISMLPPAPDFVVKLALDWRVGEAFRADCRCHICEFVAWQPKQCDNAECKKLFCTKCIDNRLLTEQTCPSCEQNFQSGQVPGDVNSYLEESSILCQEGGCNPYRYLEAEAHLASHQELKCGLNCGNQSTLNGIKGLRLHLNKSCSKVQFKCEDCNFIKERDSLLQDSHDCEVEKLKQEFAQVKLITQQQETTIQEKQKQIHDQELTIKVMFDILEKQAVIKKQMQETIDKMQQEQLQRKESGQNKVEGKIAKRKPQIRKKPKCESDDVQVNKSKLVCNNLNIKLTANCYICNKKKKSCQQIYSQSQIYYICYTCNNANAKSSS